ncbi:holothin acyltransferase-like [Branchiostoma lanceolatum]|uniref:holothin acyltransferase-like n=1 Tax=Branchiostoma lanceolatum TaxID=7740 RepID=UPI003453D8F7
MAAQVFRSFIARMAKATNSAMGGNPASFRVRQVTSVSEVSLLLEWVAAARGLPGVYDAESFYRQDPTGFYLAEVDGVPIGGISWVKYGENFAFGGHLVIKPAFRGKGYARRILEATLEAPGMSNRNIGIDSQPHLQDTYKRIIGVQSAWKNSRFRGVGTDSFKGVEREDNPVDLVSAKEVDFEHLCVFDTSVFGTPRPAFLKSWISQPGMVALAAVTTTTASEDDECSKQTKIVGYGCIRLCVESYNDVNFSRKIGPIFAESAAVGSQLYTALVSTVPLGIPFYIEVPHTNENAMEIARESGLELVFETARMFTKGSGPGGVKCSMIYGLTTLIVG